MKGIKLIAVIGFVMIFFVLNHSCKQLGPEIQFCNGINVNGVCCQLKLVNKTTGETLNPQNFTVEGNDHLEVEVQAVSDDPGVYLSSVDYLASQGNWGFVFMHYDCDPTGERIPDSTGIDCFDRTLRTEIYCVTQREGWGFMVPEDQNAQLSIEVYAVDSHGKAIDLYTQIIGSARFVAERDYIWGPEKNQVIYDNRAAIAEIMARNMIPNNNRTYSKDDYIKIIENFYHPQTGFAVGTDIFDTAGGNSLQFRGPSSAALFYDGTEKDIYDLRKIIGE